MDKQLNKQKRADVEIPAGLLGCYYNQWEASALQSELVQNLLVRSPVVLPTGEKQLIPSNDSLHNLVLKNQT